MTLNIQVNLLSGRQVSVEAELHDAVEMLRRRAQKSLGVRLGRLIDSSGVTLQGAATIGEAG